MKTIISIGILLFSTIILRGQVFPVETIKNNGSKDKRINLVFIGDGYQSTELTQYLIDVNTVVAGMFSQTPFKEYEKFFNVYAIKDPSVESGAKHPGTATDVTEPITPVTNPNNYFGSQFDISNIHRLLLPLNGSAINTTLVNNFPDYDQIFVMVNSTVYGGSGGTYATSSKHAAAAEVAIHEIGHSFAGLADEYLIGGQGERPNRTTVTDGATIKWRNWLGTNNVGIYPVGIESWQRPHQNCKMQFLNSPFCSVCTEAFINKIYSLVSPIDNFTPLSKTVNFMGVSMNFSLGLILPNPNTLKIEWVLNGVTVGRDINNVNILASKLDTGKNTLIAKVTDSTALSRIYKPATSGYLNTITWTINKGGVPSPVETINQSDKVHYDIYPNPVEDVVNIHLSSQNMMDIELSLFDMQGRRLAFIKRSRVDELLENINMSRYAAGNYALRIKIGEYVFEKNIIKQ